MLSKNAFAEKLGSSGFNPYRMLVVDLMHEFELGVWKSTFKHILRVLYATARGGTAVQQLNARYFSRFRPFRKHRSHLPRFREIPTFGRDTIRRFSNNVSGMKQLAARDFEDILQVCCCDVPLF